MLHGKRPEDHFEAVALRFELPAGGRFFLAVERGINIGAARNKEAVKPAEDLPHVRFIDADRKKHRNASRARHRLQILIANAHDGFGLQVRRYADQGLHGANILWRRKKEGPKGSSKPFDPIDSILRGIPPNQAVCLSEAVFCKTAPSTRASLKEVFFSAFSRAVLAVSASSSVCRSFTIMKRLRTSRAKRRNPR